MLWGAEDMSYERLVSRLRSRFGSADLEDRYQAELQCRRRRPKESLRELVQDIRRLMMLSYPGDQSPISENLAKEHFIVALEDPELELKIREREPRTLDSALKAAQRFEVFRNAVRQGRQCATHQVTEDSLDQVPVEVVAQVECDVKKSAISFKEQVGSGHQKGDGQASISPKKKGRKERSGKNRATQEVKQDN